MNEKRFGYFVHNINEDDEYYEIIDEEERYSFNFVTDEGLASQVCSCLNEQQATIKQLESDKAIAEDYANIFEKENVKLRKKLNNYKATVLGFVWMMEQNGKITGKDDKFVKDLFKELEE